MDGTDADPRVIAAQGLQLSGMEYIDAIFAGELPAPPISTLMSSSWSRGRSTTTRSARSTAASR